MKLLLTILLLALTRAEILERFRAAPIVNTEGLVAVFADCDAYQRRMYQSAIASFASAVCEKLYGGGLAKMERVEEPGIEISVGDGRGPDTNVYYQVKAHGSGAAYARIRLPSPGYSDTEALRRAVARGFMLSVKGEEIDDAAANRLLRSIDPALRAADRLAAVRAWMDQDVLDPSHTDEDYLSDLRCVNQPGSVWPEELRVFASRLYLYPSACDAPFDGRWHELPFRAAIPLAKKDPRILMAAYRKVPELIVLGGGRGPRMNAVVEAYCTFLRALATGRRPEDELGRLLTDAELKLKGLVP